MKDNTIVICNANYKKQLLKSINKLVNIKIYSMEDFIKTYYFNYDEKSILFVMKKYNIDYEIALEYLDNLIYVEDTKYNNFLDELVELKRELIDNKLLKVGSFNGDKKIIIYNYELTKFDSHLLKDLDYEIINNKKDEYESIIYEFDDIEDEVNFVAYKISDLIYNNVDINNIKLTNITDEYIDIINKIFSFYNLRISKCHKTSIASTIIGKTFLSHLPNLDDAINSINEYKDTKTYNKIIDICNKYIWSDDISILLDYALKHTYIDNPKYTNEIEVVDYKSYDFKDEYVFLLGYNQGIIPKTYKDEDFIKDALKPSYLDNTLDKNTYERNIVTKKLKSIKNLVITYKLKDSFTTYYPSTLELAKPVRTYIDPKISYSEINDKLKLGIKIDNLIKFNEKSEDLDLLLANYSIPYNTYSNKYTGINSNKIKEFIKNKESFNLSYSAIDNYNKCAFKFYIEKILGLSNYEEKFSVTLGNIYHYVLESNSADIREKVYEYINKNNIVLTNSNKFFIEKTISNLELIIDVIKKQNKKSSLTNIETEKYIKINLQDNINFVGFIDKVVSNDYALAIIDYKTYVKKPSLKYLDYGIDIQLPVYMYLISKAISNIKFIGFYLQNIMIDNKNINEIEKSLKLIGYTNNDSNLIECLDKDYEDSTIIDNLKINNDGTFSANSQKRMLSDNQMLSIISKTEDKIKENLKDILDAKFDINPKYDKKNISCEFCSYKDICYMQNYDLKTIKVGDEDGLY